MFQVLYGTDSGAPDLSASGYANAYQQIYTGFVNSTTGANNGNPSTISYVQLQDVEAQFQHGTRMRKHLYKQLLICCQHSPLDTIKTL